VEAAAAAAAAAAHPQNEKDDYEEDDMEEEEDDMEEDEEEATLDEMSEVMPQPAAQDDSIEGKKQGLLQALGFGVRPSPPAAKAPHEVPNAARKPGRKAGKLFGKAALPMPTTAVWPASVGAAEASFSASPPSLSRPSSCGDLGAILASTEPWRAQHGAPPPADAGFGAYAPYVPGWAMP